MVKQKLIEIVDDAHWLVRSKKRNEYTITLAEDLIQRVDYKKLRADLKEKGEIFVDVGFSVRDGAKLLFVDFNYTKAKFLDPEKIMGGKIVRRETAEMKDAMLLMPDGGNFMDYEN